LFKFLSPEITPSTTTHVPSSIITVYAVRFIFNDGSVGLHLLILQYGHFTFTTFFSTNFSTWSY